MSLKSCFPAIFALALSCAKGKSGTETPPPPAEPANAPPRTWQENWLGHSQLIARAFYDDDVAVYYDKDVDPAAKWTWKYMGDLWRYVKKTYGGHGPDGRLFAIFHTNKYSGGHPGYYYDALHNFRNVVDCGPGPWLSITSGEIDLPTHEVFHIVESTSFNTRGSVGNGVIWGDSKFAEIFQYDVYKGLGLDADAERWYNKVINVSDDFPRANTFWFRDWLFPVYRDHGKTQVLVNFFKLLSVYFPKDSTGRYTRTLNWGEFIHFFSGAAGADLKQQATLAFGWPAEWEVQLANAKKTFPDLKY